MKIRTGVYVDGFNLYYGIRRFAGCKWLNLLALAELLLPRNDITCLYLFTAKVKPRPDDPQQDIRQQTYFRALSTLPNMQIVYGHFLSNPVFMMKADLTGKVEVLKTEEKGSDVNLASRLLIDAYENQFDAAAVISNDSDLAYPIKHLREHLRKKAIIINPHPKNSVVLQRLADFHRQVRQSDLSRCQFPNSMRDDSGEFTKPAGW
jgi:uncharacterized LabA/DUF88 family protein